MMKTVEIKKGTNSRITVTFLYNPEYVEKVKTIKGHRWHPEGKYWSFPNEEGMVEEIVAVFDGEGISVDLLSIFFKVQKRIGIFQYERCRKSYNMLVRQPE